MPDRVASGEFHSRFRDVVAKIELTTPGCSLPTTGSLPIAGTPRRLDFR
jgi:hypothetical protein